MSALNKGLSTYHSVHGLYWRESNGTLLAVEGRNSLALPGAWPQLREEICSNQGSWSQLHLPSGRQINSLQITADIPALCEIRANFPPSYRNEDLHTTVAEIAHPNNLVLGVLTSRPKSLVGDVFDAWAEHFILLETQFQPFARLSQTSAHEHRRICGIIADIFEQKLKNASRDDQWHALGRQNFMDQAYGFVERSIPILLCLPAFPCKSPNPNKVGGTMPDLGEHIAIDVLRSFVKEICHVYKPGATLWVISDGHVFSDCIGVDDDKVDTYDAQLIEMYKEKYPVEEGPVPAIRFKGLKDIFMSNPDSSHSFNESWVMSHNIPHPVKTKLTAPSELCRKLLLGVSQADRAFIRSCIEEQEPHALQLYRGQTRFMLEDLAEVASVKALSMKQRKKTAALVAQEMISRNQAYSNLVELLFPNYIRLSIHAHNNSGPKFAIRLLPKSMVRPIDSLNRRLEPMLAYEFQIPTPWHNSIIKVEGDELLYLARSQVARTAIASSGMEGSWVDSPDGSYFSLKHSTPRTPIEVVGSEPGLVEQATGLDEKMPILVVRPTQPAKRVDSAFVESVKKGRWSLLVPVYSLLTFPNMMRRIWRYLTVEA